MAVGKLLVAYYLYRRHKVKKLAKQAAKINQARYTSKPSKPTSVASKPKVSKSKTSRIRRKKK